jgi:hypothetical protein
MNDLHCPKCGCDFEMSALMHETIEAKLTVVRRAADEREAELLKLQRAVEEREHRVNLDLETRLAGETARIRAEEARLAEARYASLAEERVRQKDEELAAARGRLADASMREAELLRKERAVAEREQQSALDFERRLADEATRIREREAQVAEERAGREREKHRLLVEEQRQRSDGLEKTVEELQRKLRQGSQQTQGEAQEALLSDLLAGAFELDGIEDVPKGIAGADVLHVVCAPDGRECGTIVWESKRTKTWSDDWLAKVRDDQRAAGAALAVIVTQTLPAGVRFFTEREGVWICSWSCATALAGALRALLVEVTVARRVADGRGEKMQVLFDYLTGSEFRNRVSGLVEPLAEMREDLEQEKRAVLKLWKRRERQLERARDNLSAFYGDIQGIAGQKIVELPALSLDAIGALPTPRVANEQFAGGVVSSSSGPS